MKKTLVLLLALVMTVGLMIGCAAPQEPAADPTPESEAQTTEPEAPADEPEATTGEDTPAEPDADKPLAGKVIGVSTSYLEDDFTVEMNYGIVERCEALGAEVTLSNSNSDGELQTRQIEAFIELGVDYLFVNPPTLDVCVPAVEAAADAGIRIIAFDGGVNTDKGIVTHVTTDNRAMGEALGEYFVEYIKNDLGGKATIVYEYWMEMERMQDRIDGVKSVIDAAGLDITAVELDSKGSRETAANVTANYAEDYDLILCGEMNTAWGAISTLEAQNKEGVKVGAVGDWSKEGFEAIRDGHEYYLTFSTVSPYDIAQMSVDALLKDLNGETQDRTTYVNTPTVNTDNMNDFWDFDKF